MRWIFQTYRPLEGGRWPTRCELMGFPVGRGSTSWFAVSDFGSLADTLQVDGVPCLEPAQPLRLRRE